MSDMFFAVITGIIAVILFIYVFFAVRCKGPILSNTYLFVSEKERSKIDKKAEYHMVSVVFGILATIFACLTAVSYTHLTRALIIPICLCGDFCISQVFTTDIFPAARSIFTVVHPRNFPFPSISCSTMEPRRNRTEKF